MTRRQFLEDNNFNKQTLSNQIDLAFQAIDLLSHVNESEMYIYHDNGTTEVSEELKLINESLLKDFPNFGLFLRKYSEISRRIRKGSKINDIEQLVKSEIIEELRDIKIKEILK
jgi:hypothetical protein